MKLSVFLFLLGILSVNANEIFSQTSLNFRMEKASVEEVLEQIQQQCSYDFIYDYEYVNELKAVSVEFHDASLDQVLYEVLRNTNLDYRVEDKMIVLFPREITKPVKTESVNSPVQKKKIITGKVTDNDGIPLPGVSVVVKGTTVGAATDIDGNYSIGFEVDKAILVYSFVGMIAQEFVYEGQTVLNVTLFADAEQMAEVIVTGYQTISKERSTGSYAIVKADDMRSMETSLQSKLEGLTSGVLNSSFGDGNSMASYLPDSDNDNRLIMRGISTMSENSSPLVVIDGFPSSEGLSSVNPNDIEQITFLKDAAAASIWGSQSSNGVIVITTKKGTQSKPKVSYKFTHQYIPKWDLDYLNKASADEMITFLEESFEGAPAAYMNYWAPTELGTLMQDYKNGVITEAVYNAGVAELRARGDNYGQIEDELLEAGAIQQHDLSIQGGTENISYRAAINYMKKSGGYVGNENEKINISMNNDFNINSRLKASLGINFMYEDVDYSPVYAAEPGYSGRSAVVDRITPWEMLKNEDGSYANQSSGYLSAPLGLGGSYPLSHSQSLLDTYGINTFSNILNDIDHSKRGYESYMTRLKASFNYKIIEGLNFNGGVQYEKGSRTDKSYWGKEHRGVAQARTFFAIGGPNGTIAEDKIPEGAIQQINTGDNSSYTIRGTLNYTKELGKHSFTALGGGEISKRYSEYYKTSQFGLDTKTLIEKPMDIASLSGFNFGTLGSYGYSYYFGNYDDFFQLTSTDDRYASYFGNFAYTFDNRYVFNASGRIDNFNLYGGESRFNKKPLWALGAGWNVSNEKFMEEIEWLDHLKFTYTYGSNGNVARGAIPELQISQSIDSYHNGLAGTISSPKNASLKWEETITNNLKLDFGLFNSKLSGSIDFYHRKSKDVLSGKEIDPTHGLTRVTFNNGTIVNKGFEFELGGTVMEKGDFYWGTKFLLSYNHNEVVDINTSTRSQYPEDLLRGLYSAPGKPTNGLYSFQWAGLNEQGHAQAIDQNGEASSSYIDMEGTSMLKFSGTVVPSWVSSFTTQFKYKNYELSALFVGSFGNIMRKDVPEIAIDEVYRPHADISKRWKKPGDENHTNIPKVGTRYTEPALANYLYAYADINVVSADYIKLREVNFIYNFPKKFLSSLSLGSAQAMFQVTNPLKWTKNKDGIDPEAMDMSFGKRQMPIMTSYTVGLNINF
ncbi:hypothetical protein BZG02_07980 [Labilibaculum filiforme]|uniref:SusC/RagA family TonB-linked outer membrane protein n=2 Tax=Labilibaculum filiforme TaxID=1940526 RepID=A0A2N3I0W4_9BACT|nr:hypothetical protein BZG02_07980 [Labilibaculum filiforme]